MLHNGSKFDVQMCREPVVRLQVSQQLLSSRTSQRVGLHLLTQKLLLPQQLPRAPTVVDPTRPVVAHENVYGHLDLSGNKNVWINICWSYNIYWESFEICARNIGYLPVLVWTPLCFGRGKHFEVCQGCMEGVHGDLKQHIFLVNMLHSVHKCNHFRQSKNKLTPSVVTWFEDPR